ncbi:hypothetical protein K3495_g8772 [Podosphaera aphanis]|nr:hypothetical protein K3495_g8772 [Podosphaera aphanis]
MSQDASILPIGAQVASDVPYAANITERPLSQDASILPTGAQVASNTPNESNIIESLILLNSLPTSRFGRPLRRTSRAAFSHSIATDAIAAQVVHIEEGKSSSIQVPTPLFESITVEQAMLEDPKLWKDAIKSELKSLKDANTYTILSGTAPPGKRVISSKIVLRKKFKSDGSLVRRKARIFVRGFEQQYGIDYFETFASVIRYNTLRILLSKAAVEDLDIEALDVDTAFLNPKLNEEVYMEIPDFFALQHPGINRKKNYLKLNKSLYGLKQAPHAWFQEVKEHFKQIGLKGGDSDPNLFIGRGVYVLLYVDDMLVIGPTEKVKVVKSDIVGGWKCKILGPVDTFVGIQVERNREKRMPRIHQTAYIVKLLQRLKMDKSIPKNLPLPAGTVLNPPTEDYPWNILNTTEAGLYRQIVGSVLYLSNGTRPDIAYAVGQLARFMSFFFFFITLRRACA